MDEKAIQSLQRCKTKAVLTQTDVLAIFMIKVDALPARRPTPGQVASRFGVTEKTIRDIWAGRTWRQETKHLDASRVNVCEEVRRPGRPKGNRVPRSGQDPRTHPENVPFDHSDLQSNCGNWCFHCATVCDQPLLCSQTSLSVLMSEPGPQYSSDPADPFHDDWPFWPTDMEVLMCTANY
mmetsp:Transcript_4241/g.12105  ORF Transcript_4241/g.12105 Transcript_4241/m.12105 type:complete len:180 (+) Transcript_4241:138-677(+)